MGCAHRPDQWRIGRGWSCRSSPPRPLAAARSPPPTLPAGRRRRDRLLWSASRRRRCCPSPRRAHRPGAASGRPPHGHPARAWAKTMSADGRSIQIWGWTASKALMRSKASRAVCSAVMRPRSASAAIVRADSKLMAPYALASPISASMGPTSASVRTRLRSECAPSSTAPSAR